MTLASLVAFHAAKCTDVSTVKGKVKGKGKV
jgi:hypothetical protein